MYTIYARDNAGVQREVAHCQSSVLAEMRADQIVSDQLALSATYQAVKRAAQIATDNGEYLTAAALQQQLTDMELEARYNVVVMVA